MSIKNISVGLAGLLGIMVLGATSPASANTVFDFSYTSIDPTMPFSGGGQFITTGAIPFFQVIDVNGIADAGQPGSLITGVSPYAFADEKLYFPAQDTPARFVDGFGVSFHTLSDGDFNIYFNTQEFTGYGRISSSADKFGVNNPGIQISFNVTETPLPAALSLFVGGLGALGLLARRRKRVEGAV